MLETAKAKMEPYEWAYWMEGKPAEKDIKAPDGTLLEKAGAKRDGGSYEERMGGVACWNAVMDENDYMVRSGTSSSPPDAWSSSPGARSPRGGSAARQAIWRVRAG